MSKPIGTPAALEVDLSSVRKKLDIIDPFILALIAHRNNVVVRDVALVKSRDARPQIVQLERENQQMEYTRSVIAPALGLNPFFAGQIHYSIIRESCKFQDEMVQSQSCSSLPLNGDAPDVVARKLRENLLELTKTAAPTYDADYDKASLATQMLNAYEREIIVRTANGAGEAKKAYDLGCATGRIARQLISCFEAVVGIDVSPDMIAQAEELAGGQSSRMAYLCEDLESGLNAEERSADYVVMNMGTASDIRKIEELLRSIRDVLRKDGRFYLSFYNAGAVMYQAFIPWPLPLAASYNHVFNYLNVGGYAIYAKRYTKAELEDLICGVGGLSPTEWYSYPTIASLLPNEALASAEVRQIVRLADEMLSPKMEGAYIMVAGQKT